jgi:tetrahydromethanopterin S-methyltransferase subunit C
VARDQRIIINHQLKTNAMKKVIQFTIKKGKALALALFVYAMTLLFPVNAQDGNAGINEATMRVRSYFTTGTSLMYAIGAILGLVGAVKVYQKWNSGDPDTGKVAAAWFGSCVFLVIVATVLRSFFGL